MASRNYPAIELAQRLRGLREHAWPEVSLTQKELAKALGGSRPLSVPLISSWENIHRPVTPPAERLLAYAAFFATRRSVESRPYRLVDDAELTSAEREHRDRLEQELLASRTEALSFLEAQPASRLMEALGGPWRFDDGKPVTIVCASVPREQQMALPDPDDPKLAYADLYSYADADALLELYGHIRAANPFSEVQFKKASYLTPEDYTTHLVLLGGSDWNQATKTLISMLNLPVAEAQTSQNESLLPTMYRVEDPAGTTKEFHPEWHSTYGMVSDVGHFVRAHNPFNNKRTLTLCNGISSRGVLGTVRALTDERFRERNGSYFERRFAGTDIFSVLTRVQIVDGAILTPDWTLETTRLHEWPPQP